LFVDPPPFPLVKFESNMLTPVIPAAAGSGVALLVPALYNPPSGCCLRPLDTRTFTLGDKADTVGMEEDDEEEEEPRPVLPAGVA
jgi:hypothetical protein